MNNLYKKFHGVFPGKKTKIRFDVPKELVRIGECTAIEYRCLNPSRYAENVYRHDFAKKPVLAVDDKGILYIIKAKITNRGIEG